MPVWLSGSAIGVISLWRGVKKNYGDIRIFKINGYSWRFVQDCGPKSGCGTVFFYGNYYIDLF